MNLETPKDTSTIDCLEGVYHDYYLPVTGNIQISQAFYDNIEVISLASNAMTLLSLPELSVQFGTPIYGIDHVNGTLHATYSRGIKCVPLKIIGDT